MLRSACPSTMGAIIVSAGERGWQAVPGCTAHGSAATRIGIWCKGGHLRGMRFMCMMKMQGAPRSAPAPSEDELIVMIRRGLIIASTTKSGLQRGQGVIRIGLCPLKGGCQGQLE